MTSGTEISVTQLSVTTTEQATAELRFVERPAQIGIDNRVARILQQKWLIRSDYGASFEWRDVPVYHGP